MRGGSVLPHLHSYPPHPPTEDRTLPTNGDQSEQTQDEIRDAPSIPQGFRGEG